MALQQRVVLLFILVMASGFSFAVWPSWAASTHNFPGRPRTESKIDLLLEAFTHVQGQELVRGHFIKSITEAMAKRGELILVPMGDPLIYPSGRLKKKRVPDQACQVGGLARTEVEGEVIITEQTTRRFLIQVMTMVRHEGKPTISSWSGSLGVARQDRQNHMMKLECSMKIEAPGRYDVIHILVAQPIKGAGPFKILDVTGASFNIPMQLAK